MSACKVSNQNSLKPIVAQILIGLSFAGLTYNIWFLAPLGSLLIILLSFVAWPGTSLDRLGLRIPRYQMLVALLFLLVVTPGAWLIIDVVSQAQGIHLLPVWQKPNSLELIAHTFGQTLNEEMILGALLLTSLVARSRRAPLLLISTLVAALFAFLHLIFYAWRPTTMINYGVLSTFTLLSVFAVGVLRNNLILGAGHIALAWAIHLGWNLIFMDSSYYSTTTQALLDEPAVFNAVLGNALVLGVIAIAAAISILFLVKSSNKSGALT